jgi:hypothetical protein
MTFCATVTAVMLMNGEVELNFLADGKWGWVLATLPMHEDETKTRGICYGDWWVWDPL